MFIKRIIRKSFVERRYTRRRFSADRRRFSAEEFVI